MSFLRWKCPACSHSEETPQEALFQRLRSAGLLRRVETKDAKDLNYLLQLAGSVRDKLTCPECGSGGFLPKPASVEEAAAEWGDQRKCARCPSVIPPERLEVFPDTTLCAACQQKEERGDSGSEDYCPRCGTPRQLRQRRGGIAAYELVCPSCGDRSR